MKKDIRAVGTCGCHFNLAPAELKKYKGKFVAVKNDRKTIVASGRTVNEALNNALKITKIDELARTSANNSVVSIPKIT